MGETSITRDPALQQNIIPGFFGSSLVCWASGTQGDGIAVLDPDPPGGYCAHEDQDFFPSKTELNYLVVDETSGTWGKPFFFTPIHPTTIGP